MIEIIALSVVGVYLSVFLFIFVGIRRAARKEPFNPIQAVVAFLWIIWLPFYVFYSITDRKYAD